MVHHCSHTEKISSEVHSKPLKQQFWKWDGLHPKHFTFHAFSPLTQFHYPSANDNVKIICAYFSKIPFTAPIHSRTIQRDRLAEARHIY